MKFRFRRVRRELLKDSLKDTHNVKNLADITVLINKDSIVPVAITSIKFYVYDPRCDQDLYTVMAKYTDCRVDRPEDPSFVAGFLYDVEEKDKVMILGYKCVL